MSLKLPKNTSLKDLYLEEDQTICFLIWILKQSSPCDQYISQMILEYPFQVIINSNGYGDPIKYILKNGQKHGLNRRWHENGQLMYECPWKNGQKHGCDRAWYQNGQLKYEGTWKNGQEHGKIRWWSENGQLMYEQNWENGTIVSSQKI